MPYPRLIDSGQTVRDALIALSGSARLPASAIRDLPSGGGADPETTSIVSLGSFGVDRSSPSQVSAAFNAAMTTLAMIGGGVLEVPGGLTYEINAPTVISTDGVTIRGVGGSARIRIADGANCAHFTSANTATISLENVILDGNRAEQVFNVATLNSGVIFENVTGLRMVNVEAADHVRENFKLLRCEDFYIEDCHAYRSYLDGWSIDDCHRGVFVNVGAYEMLDATRLSGQLRGFEIEDGCTNLKFFDVFCEDCDSTAGFGVRSHSGRPMCKNIMVFGLYTKRNARGLEVAELTKGVQVFGHVSEDDRRPAYIQDTSGFVLRGFRHTHSEDFVGDTTSSCFALVGDLRKCLFADGVIDSFGEAIYTAPGAGVLRDLTFENIDAHSQAARAIWLRFGRPEKVTFRNCSFTVSGAQAGIVDQDLPGATRVVFDNCEWEEGAAQTSTLLTVRINNVAITNGSRMVTNLRSAITLAAGVQGFTFENSEAVGVPGQNRIVLNCEAGPVRDLTVRNNKIAGFGRIIIMSAASEGAPNQNINISGNHLENINQGAIRVLGTAGAKWLDFLTVNNNVWVNVPNRFEGFPLGASGTNLVANGNNPPLSIPA